VIAKIIAAGRGTLHNISIKVGQELRHLLASQVSDESRSAVKEQQAASHD
jgi:hypothetical protein